MRLGIMGGTFDPVHYGHLFIAEDARVVFHLDRVLFVPNGSPPHKPDRAITPAGHRYDMTRIAVADNPLFDCSPVELNRSGPSYMVDTLDEIQLDYPGADLFTITGVDAIAEILTWKRHAEVIRKSMFIAAARPGFGLEILKQRLPTSYLERILTVGSSAPGISSTNIRARVRNGLPIRYLTPTGVVEYIETHQLYRSGSTETGAPCRTEPEPCRHADPGNIGGKR